MAGPEVIDYTPLSSSKQNRILIWRDEVATASLPSPTDAHSTSDGASSVLSPSASNTASSASSQHHAANPASRRSRLWRRLSKHIPGLNSISGASNPLEEELRLREEMRTGMYREGPAAPAARPSLEGDLWDDQGQDRLARAQRLLDEGVTKGENGEAAN